MGVFGSIVDFFKARTVEAKIQPEITVDYKFYGSIPSVQTALKEEWEGLRDQIDDNPSCIVSQKWYEYDYNEDRSEELTVAIAGVTLRLRGPSYPNPNYVKKPDIPKSETEIANERVDELIKNNGVWAFSHCSKEKYQALIDFIRATRLTKDDC